MPDGTSRDEALLLVQLLLSSRESSAAAGRAATHYELLPLPSFKAMPGFKNAVSTFLAVLFRPYMFESCH